LDVNKNANSLINLIFVGAFHLSSIIKMHLDVGFYNFLSYPIRFENWIVKCFADCTVFNL